MKKLIVFDVDGTILDSISYFERVIKEYSRANGLQEPCLESLKRGYHDPLKHDFKWSLTPAEQKRHLHAAWEEIDALSMTDEAGCVPDLFQGVEDVLARLRAQGHTLAVVTSKSEAPLLKLFEYHDIGKMFAGHRAREDVQRRNEREKPAPDMLSSIIRELSFTPENTVMVGDTVMDVGMGVTAGTHVIGVAWGAHKKQALIDAGAHHVVETHFEDVITAVGKVFA